MRADTVGFKSSAQKQEVTAYYMSIHFGICAGPVDYISRIVVGEKDAWSGRLSVQTSFDMSNLELFGGFQKEGGIGGLVTYLPGGSTQVMPEFLAAKYGRTSATMPAYRGIATIFFTEFQGVWWKGYYWSANSPYLRGVWVEVARASLGLAAAIARIYREPVVPGNSLSLVNGLTGNRSWKWDTNGDFAVGGDGGVTIWDLPSGASRAISTAATSGAVHLNDFGELITINSNTLNVHDAATGAFKSSLPVTASGTNSGFCADDITVGGTTYMLVSRYQFAGGIFPTTWQLVTRDDDGDYSLSYTVASVNTVVSVSMGPTYAYCIPGQGAFIGGDGNTDTKSIVRVEWSGSPVETLIDLSADLTADVGVCHYDKASGHVIVVCRNGDIFKYNATLTTLVASKTGNGISLGTDALLSKRLKLTASTIGLRNVSSALDVKNDIHEFSVSSLERVRIVSSSGYPQEDQTFTRSAMNQKHGGVFLPAHALTTCFWFLVPVGPFDSNPAHIIHECLTNPQWGMGAAASAIDIDSFEAAAATLYAERFGISLMWTRQAKIEDFVREILDHIEATLFVNPRTGLLTLKLIRKDYDPAGLKTFSPDNSIISNFSRKLWGETINEIVVTWTNPVNEEEVTLSYQDNANIAAQGGEIVSDGRNYYGIRRKDLAAKVAIRDLRAASAPLASCDIEADRSAWDLLPGGVVKITSPEEDGIDEIVMRVGPVDYGKPGSETVKASLVEDIFAFTLAEYTDPPEGEWTDPSENPAPAAHTKVFTLPYYLASHMIAASASADAEYPVVFAAVLAAQTGNDTFSFDLIGHVTDAAGNLTTANLGRRTIASHAELAADIAGEAQTLIASFASATIGGAGPRVGGLIVFGNGTEGDVEIGLISSIGGSGYTVNRGVLDTVPRVWPAGTPVWFVDTSMIIADQTQRADGETVEYKVLTRTSNGMLAQSLAPWISAALTGRPHLPLRPANVKVEGVGFGVVDADGLTEVNVTWSNRNRVTEDSVVLAWNAATVTPEAGQVTRIDVLDEVGNLLTTHDDLPGTSYAVPMSSFGSVTSSFIRVSAKRDGLLSLQSHQIEVIVSSGYGLGYGLNYGGA